MTRVARAIPFLTIGLLGVGCRSAVELAKPGSASAQETPAPAYKNTISWATASEQDNFGFDIYRSQNPEGPFIRLNKSPVEGAGTVDEPRSYEWVDATIDPRGTYYYYVESISMAGVRERFTPVGKADPKIPPAAPAASATPAGR